MKVDITQSNFTEALGVVRKAAQGRAVIPVLGNILLRARAGWLECQATNLNIGLTYDVPAMVHEEGEITLPAKSLCDLVATFKGADQLQLNLIPATQALKVKCGRKTVTLKGISADEFPVVKLEGDLLASMTVKEFLRLCEVSTACARDDARPLLTGIHFKANGDLKTEASDGFRLMQICRTVGECQPGSFILPSAAVKEFVGHLSDEDLVRIYSRDGIIIIKNLTFTLSAQLIEGAFPETSNIIPKKPAMRGFFDKAELLSVLKTAEVVYREIGKTVRMRVTQPDANLPCVATFTAISGEVGECDLSMDVPWQGGFGQEENGAAKTEFLIAFDGEFMKESIKAVEGATVALGFNKDSAPILVKSDQDAGDYLGVVMPMHLPKEPKKAAPRPEVEETEDDEPEQTA